ncbi:hypothetical protein [Nostoc sp. FACHB-110]|nr:hypothetical protein [Nostoc sp. FACHB-110]
MLIIIAFAAIAPRSPFSLYRCNYCCISFLAFRSFVKKDATKA